MQPISERAIKHKNDNADISFPSFEGWNIIAAVLKAIIF
jgi:hypothetical protein